MSSNKPSADGCGIRRRESTRARRLRIDATPRHGVVVVVPQGTPGARVEQFVRSKHDWIRRAQERLRHAQSAPTGSAPTLPQWLELRALDRCLGVTVLSGTRRRVVDSGDRLELTGAVEVVDQCALLVRWLKRETRRVLVPRLQQLAQAHDLTFERVAVRGQRTRWASCSGRGTISLNFRLLFLPPPLVTHVLLHELAHTRHLDHSPRFWALLADLDPDWRRHHAELADARQWVPDWLELS